MGGWSGRGEAGLSVGVKAHVAATGDSGNLRPLSLVKFGSSWDPCHSAGAAPCRDKPAWVTLWRRAGETANTTRHYGAEAFSDVWPFFPACLSVRLLCTIILIFTWPVFQAGMPVRASKFQCIREHFFSRRQTS